MLLEQHIDRPQYFYARRVLTDGRYQETNAREGGWSDLFPLRARDVDELGQAIVDCGFFELADEYLPDATAIGGSDVTWWANLKEQSGTVVLRNAPTTTLPAVEELELRLAQILQGAADAYREGLGTDADPKAP